jgi:hypothetical protein
MERKINRLNARTVASIAKCGRHADGGGLYLSISPNGGRRWVFLYRWQGKPTEIGFGSARDVTLARARELLLWRGLSEPNGIVRRQRDDT